MIRKGFVINTLTFKVEKEVEYNDEVFDGLYVKDVNAPTKEGANILFAAFTFPIECKAEVEQALAELKAAKKIYEDLQSEIYYKRFRIIKDSVLQNWTEENRKQVEARMNRK